MKPNRCNIFLMKLLKYFLTFIGVFLGFSNTLFAQYGSWEDNLNTFTIKGKVMSAQDNKPIKNIKINKVKTNQDGEFFYQDESAFRKILLEVTDIDAEANGDYIPIDTTIRYNSTDTVYLELYLHHKQKLEDYLNENKMPKSADEQEINWIGIYYTTQSYLEIKTSQIPQKIYLATSGSEIPFKESKENKIYLYKETIFLLIDKDNYKNSDFQLFIEDAKYEIEKKTNKNSGIIIIKS